MSDSNYCNCGHPWGVHNEFGCYSKHGHDEYCSCSAKPAAILAKEREQRLASTLCYPCKDHPRYRIKRKPRTPCEKCWRMWIQVNP